MEDKTHASAKNLILQKMLYERNEAKDEGKCKNIFLLIFLGKR